MGIPSLRELQLTELEILFEVDRICKANSITYYLDGGTLLGAVRHKGFIPWDDDIDISMPIADYNRFIKCAEKELADIYFLQHYTTDNFHCFYAKVRKNNTTAIESNKSELDAHNGVWIDIFPLIGVKNDKKWIKNQKKKMERYKRLYYKTTCMLPWKNLSFDKKLLRMIPLPIRGIIIDTMYRHLFSDPLKSPFCCTVWGEERVEARFNSNVFREKTELMFEGRLFPAPKYWDEYLSTVYGDYMTPPPEDKRTGGNHTITFVDLEHGGVKHNRA